jgi:glycosyltransferase involved in cell wall biosynthesis
MSIETPETLSVLKHADVVITYSQRVLNVLKELGMDSKSRLIPNFVDVESFSRPTSVGDGSGTRIVMISRLEGHKDPVTPVRAFYYVRKEVPNATFQIVGYGSLYNYINDLIQDLNLEGAVTLVSKKTDVREFLWDSDIFVATKSGYIAVLEAWAAGLAVVAPECGIMKEIISNYENGILVSPNDIEQLASAMIRLIKDRDLRRTLAMNGMKTVKKHDIGEVAPRIADIYDSLASK